MKNIKILFIPFLLSIAVSPLFAANITFTVDPTQNNVAISPYIYGSNSSIPGVKNTYFRSGGNRLSAYNWETNWSNAGSDYYYENDTLMGTKADGPGWAYTSFHTQNKANGADSLVTIPMAGYVSANGEPAVQVPNADFMNAPGLTDPHGNFFPISFVKPGFPGSYADPPNLTDGQVYDDEMVNFLVKHLGSSISGGIKFYDLDNEPGAWSSTHAEVHNYPVSYLEVAMKGVTVATQTTSLDTGAQILGPVADGWTDMINLGGAPDAGNYSSYNNGNWVTFLNYYLDQMRQASNAVGRRLLHYLDCHVYSEGTDAAGNRINNADVSQDAATTRMQLPREMWDPTFTENNWISCCVAYGPMTLIPRLQAAVSQYYPGTNIAFSEYDYGGGGDVSGGIAQADFLGVLTKYPNMMASIWDVGAGDQYLTCAFNFYLNYDGAGTHFGDTSVSAASSNVPEATVYAAKDSANPNHLNVIVLNKDYTNNNTASVTLTNLSGAITFIRAFRFDSAISVITASTAPTFTANSFTDTLPFRSATLYELSLSQGFATPTPTNSPTATWSPTSTPSSTPTATGTLATATSTPTKTPTSTVTSTPTATVVCTSLFNSCDSLTANGNWTGTNATRSISTTTKTQGTGAVQVTVNTGATWNDQIFNLDTFAPTTFTNVTQVLVDINIPASLLTGTTYNNLYLFADSPANGLYEQQFSSSGPSLAAGWNNNVAFNVDWTVGGFTSNMVLTKLWFIFNSDKTNTGTIYVDNIRLVTLCAPTATPTGSTPTPTGTPTASPTRTPTLTVTQTATPSPSRTATLTPTLTATNTSGNTSTPTSTPTNTATATPSSTRTNSPTLTASATATNSATPTPSGTPSNTATSSATATPTKTTTSTSTPTASNTPSNTSTLTATASPTNSATLSPTSTSTATPTLTPTGTLPTVTASPTLTPSSTPTLTATLTTTATSTSTLTNTATQTATRTGTNTATNTPTSSTTATTTNTLSATPSSTPTGTATSTATMTATPTPSKTPTFSPTNTLVNTGTPTLTPTKTPTGTPTTVTVAASQGSNPPGNSSQLSGASNVAVQQVLMTNTSLTSTINMTGLTLSVSGTGSPSDITSVTLWANGVSITSTTFSGTTATFTFSGPLSPSSGVTYTVTANFDSGASGTYTFNVTGASGTNGQAAQFNGLPVAGATVTVSHATATPTATPSFTPTLTLTAQPTNSPTPHPSATQVVLFPNPSNGNQPVSIAIPLTAPSDVKVQIFTTAFRKVQEKTYPSQPVGIPVAVTLTDREGVSLASGLYYVVVTTPQGRSIQKLLLLR